LKIEAIGQKNGHVKTVKIALENLEATPNLVDLGVQVVRRWVRYSSLKLLELKLQVWRYRFYGWQNLQMISNFSKLAVQLSKFGDNLQIILTHYIALCALSASLERRLEFVMSLAGLEKGWR
jgi:hypothetical protein